jgi:branched-chain amino acid aminotransferase
VHKAIHFLNGKFVTEDELLISPRDLGYTRGYAVFDFLKTYPHHRPFKLHEHIDRLYNSAALIDLKIPWSKEQVAKWVYETLKKNKDKSEKTIKIILSGGISNTMIPPEEPTIIIMVDPYTPGPGHHYEHGIGITTAKYNRPVPRAKTTHYIEGIKQVQIGQKMNAVEVVYHDDQQVYEGSRSNVFAVIENKLITTKSNILDGITKNVLLEILQLDIPIEIRDFTLTELLKATEVFLTGSGVEIHPVTKINGKKVGDGKVGKITKEVTDQFQTYTSSDKW